MSNDKTTMTTATLNVTDVSEFWRVARRLHAIYSELDRVFELDLPSCADLESTADNPEPETMDRVRQWFDEMDSRIQVWQLRQLLQSTSLQTEENLRYLIVRHRERKQKSESDKEKLDFLLVQYFAHCGPHGITERQVTLDDVARVLEPVLGTVPLSYPDWARGLDEKLQRMNDSNSLEELQNTGALLEVRELKLAVGDQYFEPALLVPFTRFNFRARRAFFRAMHLDLHAIRSTVNELERMGYTTIDCREAGLTENESLEQVRHVVHQWKTPFRAPYSGGSSFLQLILLRHCLQLTLSEAHARHAGARRSVEPAETSTVPPPAQSAAPVLVSSVPAHDEPEEEDALERCVSDIADQIAAVPAKTTPSVSAITLGGCKLLIATWEAQAFTQSEDELSRPLQRTVAARTILYVCMERHRKGEPTDLGVALDMARRQSQEMEAVVEKAKEANNIDAAVNLAATRKRLLSLIDEGERLLA